MRITGVEATPVAVPFHEDERWAFGARSGMVSILVTLMVWLVIVAIRWLSGDRLHPTTAEKTQA